MIAEVSLLRVSGSLAQEKNRLENQEKLLKLKTEIAKAEAKEKVYEEFGVIEEPPAVLLPDRPQLITPSPHVRPPEVPDPTQFITPSPHINAHELSELKSKPLNPDTRPWQPEN